MYGPGDEAHEGGTSASANGTWEREAAEKPRAMWGMYGGSTTETPKRSAERVRVIDRASEDTSDEMFDAQPPTKPFLVYRNPHVSDTEKREAVHDP